MGKPVLLVEALASRNDSGLGNMARLYVDGLHRFAARVDIRVILPSGSAYRPMFPCEIIFVEPKPQRFWIHFAFPLLILRHRPAAVLCLGQTLPCLRPSTCYALAVPDAGPLEDLGWATSSHDPYNRRWLKRMVPKADAIITLSEFTKSRLMFLLGIPGSRIRVVRPVRPSGLAERPLAVESGTRESEVQAEGDSPFPQRDPLPRPPLGEYFLALGNLEPRKNFPGLVSAYSELKRRRPDAPPLYIAGHKAWGCAAVESAIAEHGLSGSVRLPGYLSDADRRAYLANCLAFISSSRYEGWGLPLFEALSQGRPSAYHAGSSQDEFAKGMALAVDCGDSLALAGAMETLWTDGAVRHRLEEAMRRGFGAQRDYDLEGALEGALAPLVREME
ncbi:MAG: glycosyltransferase family 1 protein [Fibrobacteria bacterium]